MKKVTRKDIQKTLERILAATKDEEIPDAEEIALELTADVYGISVDELEDKLYS